MSRQTPHPGRRKCASAHRKIAAGGSLPPRCTAGRWQRSTRIEPGLYVFVLGNSVTVTTDHFNVTGSSLMSFSCEKDLAASRARLPHHPGRQASGEMMPPEHARVSKAALHYPRVMPAATRGHNEACIICSCRRRIASDGTYGRIRRYFGTGRRYGGLPETLPAGAEVVAGARCAARRRLRRAQQPGETSPGVSTPKHLAERILDSKSALEGERKHVTVLFADLKGSSE
jgi:hypothetical protein